MRSSAHQQAGSPPQFPYFGYARQDRRPRSARVAISAKVVANMLEIAGVDRVITMDLHADQIQGFFDIPVDNIYATPVLLGDLRKQNHENLLVVSPDVGGVIRARALAKQLNTDLAIIDKRRPKANVAEVMNIIGEVEGRTCVIMDDMVDTAGTLCKAAQVLKERGATQVFAYATHPVLSGGAGERIAASELDELVVTDTIPLSAEAAGVQEDAPAVERRFARGDVLANPARRLGDVALRRKLKELAKREAPASRFCVIGTDGRRFVPLLSGLTRLFDNGRSITESPFFTAWSRAAYGVES